jgi:NADPH:quinone reductase
MKALTFSKFGDSNVLEYREVSDPALKPGEILLRMKAIGLNFADLMRRNGILNVVKSKLHYINGYEGAGVVVESNHSDYKTGDRVAFADVPFANAELVAVPVENAIPLPADISFDVAASVLLQGLSAHFLSTDCHKTIANETVLIHAAAGGVGQLLIQICKLYGAKVIGLTSSENKKKIALSLGADVVYLYKEDWKDKVLTIQPKGVDVVFDSIGSTMQESLQVTKVRGQVVFFGMASGEFNPGNPLYIIGTSKTITGGDLWDYLTSKEERIKRAGQLFQWIRERKIRLSPATKFKLSEGKQAHDFLEKRHSTGKILLIP